MTTFRLAIVIPIWQRRELTALCLRHYDEMEIPLVELIRIGIISPTDPTLRQPHRTSNFQYVVAPNNPLGAKWNTAFEKLEAMNIDGAAIVGSDDFVTSAHFAAGVRAIRQGREYVKPAGVYFFDLLTGAAFHTRATHIGAASIFGRAALVKAGWRPFVDERNAGVDALLARRLRRWRVTAVGLIPSVPMSGPEAIIDVKSHRLNDEGTEVRNENIHSFQKMRRSFSRTALDLGGEGVLREYLPAVASDLLMLSRKVRRLAARP